MWKERTSNLLRITSITHFMTYPLSVVNVIFIALKSMIMIHSDTSIPNNQS